ncbi:unnamed protein product [Paramecium sonneborni]|uniref:Cullin family profile domain-containing protein n=1 Tax=Paramecium sonneborni TaxID=65129 RepID=A0A8S1QKG2_9CILI|nr:unnamed protein product [Paramecium sonneborni]
MDQDYKPIDIDYFTQQIHSLILECKQSHNFDINLFVQFASKTRNQINNTSNSKQACFLIVIQLQKCLLQIFAQQFQNKPELDEFFDAFKEYETAAKYLNLACYHIFQNLSQKEKFIFWKIAVCKIIKDNIENIRSRIFTSLEDLLDQIYKKQESEYVHKVQEKELKQDRENLKKKFFNHLQILLGFSMNENLIQNDINVFDDLCQRLYKFIKNEYEQKFKRWSQVYSVKDYLCLVEREFEINEQLFSCLNNIQQFKSHYLNIFRIIYENLVFKYKDVVLKDERGFIGLLNEFFSQQDQFDEAVSGEIIQILRVYSRFQDQEQYFKDFKQKFQQFVRENIEQQYKKQTLHHELEKQKSKYKSLVKILGDIYDKFDNLIRMCFKESDNFNGRYDLEMIVQSELKLFFINLEQSIQLTLKLCDYVHDLMMQLAKSDDQSQIKDNQEEILKVQKCLLPSVKDFDYYLIINNYRLASRLLNYLIFFEKQHALYHLDNEQYILDQMKQFCGEKKLKKINKMISETKDLLNKKIAIEFREDLTEIILINKKKWPKLYNNDQNVFQELQIFKQQFITKRQNYNARENSIKIEFSDTLSFVEIYWSEVEKTLIINCVQAAILFLFNEDDDMRTLNEIAESLKLETHQVLFQLERLVAQKILWNDKDSYFLNNSQIEQEVKEPLIVIDHNIYENQQYMNEFKPLYDKTQDLKFQLDAFIMKNLKIEKQMNHTILFDLVSKKFYPIPMSNDKLKESLEWLIKNEYICRDQKEKSVYLYK